MQASSTEIRCHVRGLEPLGPGLPPCSPLTPHTSCTCTVKVLTKLEATDGGAATSIPQVCGGVRRWVGGSLAHATNRASLDSAPCTTEAAVLRVRLAQFVFDFDAVKAQCGEDSSFALERLVRR